MEELVQITKILSVQDSNETTKSNSFNCNSIVEKFQQCDNVAINLIVEFINSKLKMPQKESINIEKVKI